MTGVIFQTIWAAGLIGAGRTAAERLLAAPVRLFPSLIASAFGVATAIAAAKALAAQASGLTADAAFACTSSLVMLAAIALFNLVSRSKEAAFDRAPAAAVPHPFRSLTARFARTRRYTQLVWLAAHHGLGPLAMVRGREQRSEQAVGRALRDALQDAGGIFIKFGQALSTRSDLLPAAIAWELSSLQDEVPPVPAPVIRQTIAHELGQPVERVFSAFDDTPLAAASLAQVHRGTLCSGEAVVVKVQRPGTETLVKRDMQILQRIAASAEKRAGWARRIGAASLARGFADNLHQELDFRQEAHNLDSIARGLAQTHAIRIPRTYPELTTRRVLTEECLEGASLRRGPAVIAARQLDPCTVARSLLDGFLCQVLDVGVFHADPHPGNVLITPDGSLGLLDFGSVGRLDTLQQAALAQAFLAIARRQPRLLRDALLELSESEHNIDADALDHALAQLFARRLGDGTATGAEALGDLLALIVRFGLALDPQLAGLFRALATLDGTLRVIDPRFDLISEARDLGAKRGTGVPGPAEAARDITGEFLELLPALRRLPRRLDQLGHLAERGELALRVRLFADDRDAVRLDRLTDRLLLAFFSASVGLVSALLLAFPAGPIIAGTTRLDQVIGYAGLTAATILGLRVLAAIGHHQEGR